MFHGADLALRWWSTLEQMQDGLLATNCASEGIRPVAEVWSAVWTDLSGSLFRAAREAERDGTHAGVAAGAIDLMPTNWCLRRTELVMDLRLEWMQALAAKIDTATASQPTKGGRLSEADINTIVTKLNVKIGKGRHKEGGGGQLVVKLPKTKNQKGKGGGGQAQQGKARDEDSPLGEALRAAGFSSLYEAKTSWLKEGDNGNNCFWACSGFSKKMGGCKIDDCKYKSSHGNG